MSKLMTALFLSAGMAFAVPGVAQVNAPKASATAMSKDDYGMAKKNADAQYKIDKDACSSRSGNARDICVAEAKGKDDVAKAEAEAAYKNTPSAAEDARIARAQAKYNVAKEQCDDLAGNPKDVCIKEAKAALVKGKADAKVSRVVADTGQDAATKRDEARKDASMDKREADYKVAVEKCEALAGSTKDACIGNAKAQYGRS